jgi:hypothetical protein
MHLGMKQWISNITVFLLLCACQGNMIRQELHRVDSLNQYQSKGQGVVL